MYVHMCKYMYFRSWQTILSMRAHEKIEIPKWWKCRVSYLMGPIRAWFLCSHCFFSTFPFDKFPYMFVWFWNYRRWLGWATLRHNMREKRCHMAPKGSTVAGALLLCQVVPGHWWTVVDATDETSGRWTGYLSLKENWGTVFIEPCCLLVGYQIDQIVDLVSTCFNHQI